MVTIIYYRYRYSDLHYRYEPAYSMNIDILIVSMLSRDQYLVRLNQLDFLIT